MRILPLLLITLLSCSTERDYRKDWAGAWSSDANPNAIYHFSLDGTWTGWDLEMPDKEQNDGTYSVTKDRYQMTYGAIHYGQSYYRYDAGSWEIIGDKLVCYEDPPEDGDKDIKVARVYSRRRGFKIDTPKLNMLGRTLDEMEKRKSADNVSEVEQLLRTLPPYDRANN